MSKPIHGSERRIKCLPDGSRFEAHGAVEEALSDSEVAMDSLPA
jgi:hypothetical protein